VDGRRGGDLVVDSTAIAQQPENEKLPRLIERAAAALAKATTAAEVLEVKVEAAAIYDAAKLAKRFATAKQAHDTVIAACHKAQADALLIEARAEIRLAEEYDAAQARGEVSSAGRPRTKNIPDENNFSSTVTDIGLTSKQVHEARKVRDAEKAQPGLLERTLATGEPTRARLNRAVDAVLKPPPPPPAKVEPTPKPVTQQEDHQQEEVSTREWLLAKLSEEEPNNAEVRRCSYNAYLLGFRAAAEFIADLFENCSKAARKRNDKIYADVLVDIAPIARTADKGVLADGTDMRSYILEWAAYDLEDWAAIGLIENRERALKAAAKKAAHKAL
jgi:hypothetical protein